MIGIDLSTVKTEKDMITAVGGLERPVRGRRSLVSVITLYVGPMNVEGYPRDTIWAQAADAYGDGDDNWNLTVPVRELSVDEAIAALTAWF